MTKRSLLKTLTAGIFAVGDWKKLHEEWPKEGHYHLKEITFPESPRFSVIDAMAKEGTENQEG